MKNICLIIFIFVQFSSIAQINNTLNTDSVSFVTEIDKDNATKDGIYLNEYVVNIDYEEIIKLHGKKLRISGKVTIIEGISSEVNSEEETGLIKQGRLNDTKYIANPIIEIIEN